MHHVQEDKQIKEKDDQIWIQRGKRGFVVIRRGSFVKRFRGVLKIGTV